MYLPFSLNKVPVFSLLLMKMLMLMQLTIIASQIYKNMMRWNTLGQVNSWWLYLIGSEGEKASDFLSLYRLGSCVFCHCIVCEIWIQLANFVCCIGIREYHYLNVEKLICICDESQVSWSTGAKPPLSWYNTLGKHQYDDTWWNDVKYKGPEIWIFGSEYVWYGMIQNIRDRKPKKLQKGRKRSSRSRVWRALTLNLMILRWCLK